MTLKRQYRNFGMLMLQIRVDQTKPMYTLLTPPIRDNSLFVLLASLTCSNVRKTACLTSHEVSVSAPNIRTKLHLWWQLTLFKHNTIVTQFPSKWTLFFYFCQTWEFSSEYCYMLQNSYILILAHEWFKWLVYLGRWLIWVDWSAVSNHMFRSHGNAKESCLVLVVWLFSGQEE